MATRTAKRPLNKCGSCGHTWYPKGRSLSVRCPECRTTGTKKAGAGVGAAVLFLDALSVFGGEKESQTTSDVRGPGRFGNTSDAIGRWGAIRAERTTDDGEISGASSSGIRDAKPTPDAARITASERSAEPFENAAVLASHAVAASDKNADRLRRRTILLANAPTLPVVGGASIGSPPGSACHAGAQKASLAMTQTSAP
jgi:hypothetical protein